MHVRSGNHGEESKNAPELVTWVNTGKNGCAVTGILGRMDVPDPVKEQLNANYRSVLASGPLGRNMECVRLLVVKGPR